MHDSYPRLAAVQRAVRLHSASLVTEMSLDLSATHEYKASKDCTPGREWCRSGDST